MARTTCFRCGEPKTGSHKSYCKACIKEYYKDRTRETCAKCGKLRTGTARSYCIECTRMMNNEWAANNRGKRAEYKRKGTYGLTQDQFETMMEDQSSLCLICSAELTVTGKTSTSVAVDHDHITDDVRGLLCSNCNRGLGFFQDNPDILVAAAAYILRYQMTHGKTE